MECLVVGEEDNLKRLDVVLASHGKISSRSDAKRIILEGDVRINESTDNIAPKRFVKTGDVITFSLLSKPGYDFSPAPYPLDIIYEDSSLIVVNKPAGMVVHPAPGHHKDTLVNYLLYHTQLSANNKVRPGIVHRIDKDTSGLLVIAKDDMTHENLADQFFHHTVVRKYQAIVWGEPDLPSGRINQPLGRDPNNRIKFTIRQNGKSAITNWRVLRRYKYLSLIECRLETGRTHQIRVHLSSIGHPVLGDPVYGQYREYGPKLPQPVKNYLIGYQGQALHAKTLGFIHPGTHDQMSFDSELPEKMTTLLSLLDTISLE